VNIKLQDRNYRIPFKQMIYIGDGYTDIPCFALLKKNEGIAFGVYDPKKERKWNQAWGFVKDNRIDGLLPAVYGKGSPLEDQLKMALAEPTLESVQRARFEARLNEIAQYLSKR